MMRQWILVYSSKELNESGTQAVGRASIRVKLGFSLPILGHNFLFTFLLLKLRNTEKFKLILLLVSFPILPTCTRK